MEIKKAQPAKNAVRIASVAQASSSGSAVFGAAAALHKHETTYGKGVG